MAKLTTLQCVIGNAGVIPADGSAAFAATTGWGLPPPRLPNHLWCEVASHPQKAGAQHAEQAAHFGGADGVHWTRGTIQTVLSTG